MCDIEVNRSRGGNPERNMANNLFSPTYKLIILLISL